MDAKRLMRVGCIVLVLAAVCLAVPALAENSTTVEITAYEVSVVSDNVIGNNYTLNGGAGPSVVVAKGGSVTIKVTSLPAGYKFKVVLPGREGTTINREDSYVLNNIDSNMQLTLAAVRPYVPPTPSGGGGGYVAPPEVLPEEPPIVPPELAEEQVTEDVSKTYAEKTFVVVSAASTAAPSADAQSADVLEYVKTVELKLTAAELAGVRVTNAKGARAIVQTDTVPPGVEPVTFCRVYDISPLDPDVELKEVTVTVPKEDVVQSGLTIHDVTIYHYLEDYNLWVPLDTLKIMQDSKNYYYTAATDSASPFGVLIMRFAAEQTLSDIPVEPVTTPGFGVLAVMAGLGAVLLKRKE